MNDKTYKNIGISIKEHRKLAKLTQKRLADLAGVGKTVVFDLEHGKSTVQLETLVKICRVLNMTLEVRSPLAKEMR